MKKSAFIVLLAVAFCGMLAVGACAGIISSDETIRYKITVTIATPEGDKVGSAVREASKHTEKSILPEQGGTFYGINKGEAVVIDLGSHGLIFGLMTDESNEPRHIFRTLAENNISSFDLPPDAFQKFVRFADLHDPNSVELFPLGDGTYLKSEHVEITKDPVTWRIDDYLPWLGNVKMVGLNGKRTARGAPLGLAGNNFQRGNE